MALLPAFVQRTFCQQYQLRPGTTKRIIASTTLETPSDRLRIIFELEVDSEPAQGDVTEVRHTHPDQGNLSSTRWPPCAVDTMTTTTMTGWRRVGETLTTRSRGPDRGRGLRNAGQGPPRRTSGPGPSRRWMTASANTAITAITAVTRIGRETEHAVPLLRQTTAASTSAASMTTITTITTITITTTIINELIDKRMRRPPPRKLAAPPSCPTRRATSRTNTISRVSRRCSPTIWTYKRGGTSTTWTPTSRRADGRVS